MLRQLQLVSTVFFCIDSVLMLDSDLKSSKVVTLVYLSGTKVFTQLKSKKPLRKVPADDGVVVDFDEEDLEAEYIDSQADNDEDIVEATPVATRTRHGKGKGKAIDPFRLMGTLTKELEGMSFALDSSK